jgi:hypothetical protein
MSKLTSNAAVLIMTHTWITNFVVQFLDKPFTLCNQFSKLFAQKPSLLIRRLITFFCFTYEILG